MIYNDLSLYLAKLIGLTIFILGTAMVVNKSNFQKTAQEMSHSHAFVTLIAFIPLVIGLAMILAHNVWVMDWPVIITLFGWLIFLCGIIRLFFHNYIMKLLVKISRTGKKFLYGGIIMIFLGAILAYIGFTRII
jgi:hypothetical protein